MLLFLHLQPLSLLWFVIIASALYYLVYVLLFMSSRILVFLCNWLSFGREFQYLK